ncbi:hypothetical protein GCM10020220_074700 [Nonomuraea rubra]
MTAITPYVVRRSVVRAGALARPRGRRFHHIQAHGDHQRDDGQAGPQHHDQVRGGRRIGGLVQGDALFDGLGEHAVLGPAVGDQHPAAVLVDVEGLCAADGSRRGSVTIV